MSGSPDIEPHADGDRHRLLAALAALRPHDHLCLIYNTLEEQLAAAVPFVRLGLERGERCIYIVDENTAETVITALRADGVDTDSALASGAFFLLTTQDTYLKEGSFDPEAMIAMLTAETETAKKLGYAALRVTGEMTWALGDAPGAERLIEYEARLNEFFPHHDCLAICQYNRRRFPGETIRDVILTHPIVIHGGQVYHNIHFVPPAEFLGEDRAAREADRLLDVLAGQQALLDKGQRRADESESRFRSLFDSMTEGVALHEMVYVDDGPTDYRILNVNPAYARQTSLAAGEVRGRLASEVYGGETPYLDIYADVAAGGEPRTFEVYHEPLQRHFRIGVVSPERGTFATIFEDITERRRTEQALRETSGYLANLLDYAKAPIVTWDPEYRITRFNNAFEALTGLTEAEVLRQPLDILFPDDSRERSLQLIRETPTAEHWEAVEIPIRRADGEVRIALWNSATLLDADGVTPVATIAQGQDITERVNAEQALRKSEVRYRDLAQNMTSAVVVYEATPDGQDFIIREFNPAAERIERVDKADAIGRLVTEVFPGVEAFGILDVFRQVWATGQTMYHPVGMYADERLVGWRENHIYRLPGGEVVAVYEDVGERVVAQDALARAKELLDRTQEISRVGGWEYDVAAGRLTWTDETYRIHGLDRSYDPNGIEADVSFYVPESAPLVHAAFRRAVETGEPYDLEVELTRADGKRIWVRTIGQPVMEDGSVVRVTGNIADITERKRAEQALRESEEKFKYVFDHSVMGMSITLPTGEVSVNAAFCEMLGYEQEELDNATWQALSHPDDIEATQRIVEALQSGEAESARFVKRYLHKNGSVVWADVGTALRRDADGTPLYFMTTVLDITERQRALDEIARLNNELEQRVSDRTAELESVNKELEAFSYSVSHDLRAPLRHVSGFVDLLKDDPGTHLDDPGQRYLTRIQAGVTQMGQLIDELLQFSRAGRAELRLVTVDMDRVLREALKAVLAEWPERAIDWTIDPLPRARGDEAVLRVVWTNLLDNAVKFSGQRERAGIEIGARESDGEVEYWVHDDGAGFDMRYADKLFGVFQRLHPVRDFPGTGIGLANVQRLITRLGGRVWGEGAVDAGATFHFSLPR